MGLVVATVLLGCAPRIDGYSSAGGGGTTANSTGADADHTAGESEPTGPSFPDLGTPAPTVRVVQIAVIRGTDLGQGLGTHLEFAGDHNHDGVEDLLVGQVAGRAHVLFGGSFEAETTLAVDGAATGKTYLMTNYVNVASLGDFDANGTPDLIFVGPRIHHWDPYELLVVYSDATDTVIDLRLPDTLAPGKTARIQGEPSTYDIGGQREGNDNRSLGHADIDNDGRGDLIAGQNDAVYIVFGQDRAEPLPTLEQIEAGIGGKYIRSNVGIGESVLGLPFETPDGDAHVAIAAESIMWLLPDTFDPGSKGEGTCISNSSPDCGARFILDDNAAAHSIAYSPNADPARRRVAVGSPFERELVMLFPNLEGAAHHDDATLFYGSGIDGSGAGLGWGVAFVGDLDGNGIPDLAMSSLEPSEVYVALSPAEVTSVALDDAVASGKAAKVAGVPGDNFGYRVQAGRDVTGDGVADLVVSAPSDADGANQGGAIYIYTPVYE